MNISFSPVTWDYRLVDDRYHVYITGYTEKDEEVMIRLNGFRSFVYLELPSKVKWSEDKAAGLFRALKERFNRITFLDYVYSGQKLAFHGRRPFQAMTLFFRSHSECSSFDGAMSRESKAEWGHERGIFVPGVGVLMRKEFTVHESKIPPEIKLSSVLNLPMAGWLKVKASEPRLPFTKDDISCYTTDWMSVEENKEIDSTTTLIHPKALSFDLECYSSNHNSKIPNPKEPSNPIITIGMVFFRFGKKDSRSVVICQGLSLEIKGVEVIECEGEKQLIIAFIELIEEENPTCFVGHNILRFDWPYLLARAEMYGLLPRLLRLDRIDGRIADIGKTFWTSSAYGVQEFEYPSYTGRIHIDTYVELQRNPLPGIKLSKFSLEEVSSEVLKEHKKDLTPMELFRMYSIWLKLRPLFERGSSLKKIKKAMPVTEKKSSGKVIEVRKAILEAKSEKEMDKALKLAITYINDYCVQDCLLVKKLCEKLNIWIGLQAMSNVTCVPISYLHTRGQMIKVLSLVLRKALDRNMVIDKQTSKMSPYEGATVIDNKRKARKMVGAGDFASLYPSMIISENVSPDSKDTHGFRKEDFNTLTWEEHVGCEHDTKKRKTKVKKERIICTTRTVRLLKVKVLEDGTIENEGVFPAVERYLTGRRKIEKASMAKVNALIRCHDGVADKKEVEEYKGKGWEICEKGELKELRRIELGIRKDVLNALQNSLKLAANSAYGGLGAETSLLRDLDCAATVTFLGRRSIAGAIEYTLEHFPGTELLYGDTDSMMLVTGAKTPKEAHEIMLRVTKEVTHFLKCKLLGIDSKEKMTPEMKRAYDALPLNLDFERMFELFILFRKKRYIASPVNKDGVVEKTVNKGVTLVRRDNAQITRDIYTLMRDHLIRLLKSDTKDVASEMRYLFCKESYTFFGQPSSEDPKTGIQDSKWIIFTAVKNVVDYAAKTKEGFIDKHGNVFEPRDALDPRLVYDKAPAHAHLALKMMKRGDVVPPNTRLEWVILEGPGELRDKIEDYDYYRENKEEKGLTIDRSYYFENRVSTQVDELIKVTWEKKRIPYVDYDEVLKEVFRVVAVQGRNFEERVKSATKLRKKIEVGGQVYDLRELARKSFARSIIVKVCKQASVPTPHRRLPRMKAKHRQEFLVVDDHFLQQLAKSHEVYRQVVCELNCKFSPVVFS